MSIINSIISRNNKQQVPFTIYEQAYLTSEQDEIAQQQYSAITMTGFYEFGYSAEVNIAFEPLENSQFSSDSIQTTPFQIFCVGTLSQVIKKKGYNAADILQDQADFETAMNKYLTNTTLLAIVPSAPLFRIYQNLKLLSFRYDFTADRTNLVVYMTFRQIRQTTTQYGGLTQNQVANPNNSSVVNNGNVNGLIPVSDIASTLDPGESVVD